MADAARQALALLPVAATVLTAFALRPKPLRSKTGADRVDGPADEPTVAPIRLGIMRGALTIAALAIIAVELLSTMDWIDPASFVVFWLAVTVGAAALAIGRQRRDGWPTRVSGWPLLWRIRGCRVSGWPLLWRIRRAWGGLTGASRVVLVALTGLVLAELVLALASAPNNYDSNYYHLSKVEHWVADHNVGVYATVQLQQVAFAPGGEYLLLHLRLLTGGDGLDNLVQWAAALGAGLAVSRVAAQLGAGRLGQLLAVTTVLTAPMVVLQSSSTQTDLIVTAWVSCAASLALDGLRHRVSLAARPGDLLALGAAAGLCATTKSTGLMGLAAVLTLWGLAQLRLGSRHLLGTVGAALSIIVVALLLFGPFMLRMQRTFGSPLGPPEYTQGLSMQRHDPAALLVNALRIGASTLVVPAPAINQAVADGVIETARRLGVDPRDPQITLTSGVYPDPRWKPDEDHSPFPIQSLLVLTGVAVTLVVRRVPGAVRAYAATVALTMLLTVAIVKWQLWGNRLLLPALALGAPLVGWWLEALPRRVRGRWRPIVAGTLTVVLVAGFAGAYGSVLLGRPRRLIGHDSVFTLTEWQQRFARQPGRLRIYQAVADRVTARGAQRIGLVVQGDQWEYPFWLMLPGRHFETLESLVPGRPPAQVRDVDAVICVSPPAACHSHVPDGWHYEQVDDLVAVALRP
jgi:hypothetical protein